MSNSFRTIPVTTGILRYMRSKRTGFVEAIMDLYKPTTAKQLNQTLKDIEASEKALIRSLKTLTQEHVNIESGTYATYQNLKSEIEALRNSIKSSSASERPLLQEKYKKKKDQLRKRRRRGLELERKHDALGQAIKFVQKAIDSVGQAQAYVNSYYQSSLSPMADYDDTPSYRDAINAAMEKVMAAIETSKVIKNDDPQSDEFVFVFYANPGLESTARNKRHLLEHKQKIKKIKLNINQGCMTNSLQHALEREQRIIESLEKALANANIVKKNFNGDILLDMLYRFERRYKFYSNPVPALREVRISKGKLYITVAKPDTYSDTNSLEAIIANTSLQMDIDWDFCMMPPSQHRPNGFVLTKWSEQRKCIVPAWEFPAEILDKIPEYVSIKKFEEQEARRRAKEQARIMKANIQQHKKH